MLSIKIGKAMQEVMTVHAERIAGDEVQSAHLDPRRCGTGSDVGVRIFEESLGNL